MTVPNTTYRILVEKLGDSDPSQFIGNEGEVFYDPNNPALKLSDGTTPGGVSVGGGGGGNANTGNIVFDGNDITNEDDINITSGDDLRITAYDVLQLRTETDDVDIIVNYDGEDEKRWTFNRNGNLELPPGGDIVDDDGNSVLGGNANTGDVTFSENQVIGAGEGSGDGNGYSTLELVPDSNLYENDQYIIVDPTAPSHIHLRAGGTQDNSNAQLFLGGEKNHVRVIDGEEGGVRLSNETVSTDFNAYTLSADFTSATWVADPGSGGSYVEVIGASQELGNNIFNATDNDESYIEINSSESGFVTLQLNGASNFGGGTYRFSSSTVPDPDLQTISNINISVANERRNEIRLEDNDLRIEVYDDIRITGGDVVSIRNNATDEPITIIPNYDFNEQRWAFNPDGTLTFPDETIQITGITSEKTTEWDAAYGWGDHSVVGYATETYVTNAISALNLPEDLSDLSDTTNLLPSNSRGRQIVIDGSRTASYVENGTVDRPFKTFSAAISSAVADGGNNYTFLILGSTISENVDFSGTPFEFITVATPDRAVISGTFSITNNSNLKQLVIRNIEFGGAVTITGDGTANQLNNTGFYNASFSSTLNITAINSLAFYQVAVFGVSTFTNINYIYINGAQFTADCTLRADNTGTYPVPSNGVSPAIVIAFDYIANNVFLVKGGTATMVFQPHMSRMGLGAGNYTIPSGFQVFPHSSVLRGTWTNSGTLTFRNSSHDNAIGGTAPTYTGTIGGSSVRVGVSTITSTDVSNWNTAYGWGDHNTAGYLEPNTEAIPATPISTGTKGEVRYDTTHAYICVSTDVWIRAGIETSWV